MRTSFYSETYQGKTIKIAESYDLIGFAIAIEKNGTVDYLELTIWNSPIKLVT